MRNLLLMVHQHGSDDVTCKPRINVGTEEIHPSDHARNIGVIFDSTLSMNNHVNNIVKSSFYH
jgi:hypothetical protein